MITQALYSWKVIISLITRWLVGTLLILASSLKLHAFLNHDISLISAILTGGAWLDVVSIYCEIILGMLLLTGFHAWTVTVLTAGFFAILSLTSLYLAINGQSSCGCFGVVEIHPWITFGADLLLFSALLLISRWNRDQRVPFNAGFRIAIKTMMMVAGTSVAFFAFNTDSLATLSRLRGEFLQLSPSVLYAGSGTANEWRDITISFINNSDQTIQVQGGSSNCSCISTDSLPISVAPHATQPFVVQVRFGKTKGWFLQRFLLYTSSKQTPIIIGYVTGRVTSTPSS